MKKIIQVQEGVTDEFYRSVIDKLNASLSLYKNLIGILPCQDLFEPLEQAAYSQDAQINHMLSITMCLLKHVPASPLLDQLFTNFMKDYLHLADSAMPAFSGELYLSHKYVLQQKHQLWHPAQNAKVNCMPL